MKSKTAQEYIDSLDFWVKTGESRQTLVVHFSDAEKAIEMAEEEIKEKCCIAFRNFTLRATLANVSGEHLDLEEEFKKTMAQI